MKLYDAAWAPSPRRVRMFLAEKGLEIDRIVIDLRGGEHLQADYLAVNPRGVVPTLMLDDGTVISESGAICRYFEALRPEPPLFGTNPLAVARVEEWTRRIEQDGYAAAVYAFRNGSPRMEGRGLPGHGPAVPLIPALVDRAAIMWPRFIESLDEQLRTTDWIAGDFYSFADISAIVAIDFGKAAKMAVPESATNVARWHAAASARPGAAA